MRDSTFELYAQKLPIGSLVRYTDTYRVRGWRMLNGQQICDMLTDGCIGRLTHLEPRDGMVPSAYICPLDSVSDKPTIGILADNIEVWSE